MEMFPRRHVKKIFAARPYEDVTLPELMEGTSFTETQIRTAIANMRQEDKTFRLRVAATRPRSDGRPGTPSAIAWVYEPPPAPEQDTETRPEENVGSGQTFESFEEFDKFMGITPSDEDTERTDLTDEGFRFTPETGITFGGVPMQREGRGSIVGNLATNMLDVLMAAGEAEGKSNGAAVYTELATTRSGMRLVEDADGEVYRLVKLDG